MRRLKTLLKKTLRSRLFLPVLERYVTSQISRINALADPQLGILVLDVERFYPGDLDRLGERAQLYRLPSDCRNRLYSLFFTAEEVGTFRQYNFTDHLKRKEREFLDFLRLLLPRLASRLPFDCVVTCNYIYVQNRLIAKACKDTRIPFIDLNRESTQDPIVNERFKQKYETLRLHMGFFGNAICVYNENMKRFLCDLCVCSPDDIHVVGALRTDTLLSKVPESRGHKENKQVTLFSFRHVPMGLAIVGYRDGFSPDGTMGFTGLFDDVHSAFAKLAKKNPATQFVIKLKWLTPWQDYVHRAIRRAGASLDELDNLTVAGENEDAIDLILRSQVVISLNSTTLLQARLANRVTIIPYFGEIADQYPDTLQYRADLSEFILAHSREELMRLVEDYIDAPALLPSTPGIFDKYIGFTDGKNLDRVMSVLLKECTKSKRLFPSIIP